MKSFAIFAIVFLLCLAADSRCFAREKPGADRSAGWFTPPPDYPSEAREKAIAGDCVVRVVADAHGTVATAEIAESSGDPTLDQAILKFARRNWRGPPRASANIPVSFYLGKSFQVLLNAYTQVLRSRVGASWFASMDANTRRIPAGTVRVAFAVNPNGEIQNIRLVSPAKDNPPLAELSIWVLKNTKLPPMPPELVRGIKGGRIEVTDWKFAHF